MSLQSQPQPPSPSPAPDKTKMTIPDLTAETLMPVKGVGLSAFARMVWGIGMVIVLSIGWLVYSKFDIDRLRGADHFIDKARHAVDAKDWPAALSAIQKVPGEARDQLRFWRILADYLIGTRTGPATLAQTLEKLKGSAYFKPQDPIWQAMAFLADHKVGAARAALDATPAELHDSLLYLDAQVSLLKSEGRKREAAQAEHVLFARFPKEPSLVVRKAARDLTGTFLEIQQAAVESLWEVAESKNPSSMAAIHALASYAGLTPAQALRLQRLVINHEEAPMDDRLNVASIVARLDPARREAVLQAEIQHYKDAGPEALKQLVAWLAREHEFRKISQLVPQEALRQSAELFPAIAQDLAQREQWADLQKLLEKGRPLPVSNARAATWRAIVARKLQPEVPQAVRAHLEEAVAEALLKNDRHALSTAIVLAQEWDMFDVALEVTRKLAKPDSPLEMEMLDKCWKFASHLKREDVLLEVAARMASLRPGDPQIVRRHDYLRLLRGEAIEVVRAKQGVGDAQSGLTDQDLLLAALKSYRLGDLPSALATVEKIQTTADMTPGQIAVYAGILAKKTDNNNRAYEIAENVQLGLLLPEEEAFLRMAF